MDVKYDRRLIVYLFCGIIEVQLKPGFVFDVARDGAGDDWGFGGDEIVGYQQKQANHDGQYN